MVRKMVCALLTIGALTGLGLQANAAGRRGSIQISLDTGELPVTNGAVTLYRVGDPVEDGYRITDAFGGGIVKQADATSVHLAQWLAEGAGENGKTVYLDVDGNVTFSYLEEGLYLVLQTERMDGFYPIRPVLVTLPDENQWDARIQRTPDPIIAENPQTGQGMWPFLGAMGMVASGMGIYFCIDSKRKK